MSLLAAFHIPGAVPGRTHGSMRATLAGVVRRLADSRLESPALIALNAQAPARPCPRMAARWRSVSSPDGSSRLEAVWHADH